MATNIRVYYKFSYIVGIHIDILIAEMTICQLLNPLIIVTMSVD